MMVVVNTKNDCSKRIASKRSTPSIYKKKTVQVWGFVNIISNRIVVVVLRYPIDNESVK